MTLSQEVTEYNYKYLSMQLPQITQDEPAANQELIGLIRERYANTPEGRFNFELGEINTLRMMLGTEGVNASLHKLLSQFFISKIENGYCYYKLKSFLSLKESDLISAISLQSDLLSQKKSDLHKINHLILMREVLLSKLQGTNELSKQCWDYIDDIRFINEEIIRNVRQWKKQVLQKGIDKQVIVYLYKNDNYLTKMITDNHEIIQKFNNKQDVFWKAPNPFFVTTVQKDQKLSPQSINSYLEILSQEKARQLKMMIESPFAKANKSGVVENQLVLLRNKFEDQKVEKIKTIYQGRQESLRASRQTGFNINQQKIDLMTMKNESSIKNLEKLIKIKEIEVLKQLNKKKINSFQTKAEDRNQRSNQGKSEQFASKIQILKAEVQKSMNLNAQKEKRKAKLPKTESQLKASRPKIKILAQRQTQVESVVKGIIDSINSQSNKMTRSRSTFYKQINIQELSKEKTQQKQGEQTKKNETANMIASAYSFSSIPNKRNAQSTSVRFNIKLSTSSKKINKDKSRSRQQQLKQVKQSLHILNQRIRQQTIKNIYSNKSKNLQNQSNSRLKSVPKEQVEQKKQVELQVMSNNNSILNTYDQSIKKKEDHISQLKKRLVELRAKNSEQSRIKVQETPSQSSLIKQSLHKERQSLQLQQLRIKQEMKKEQLKFLALKEKEYQLKEVEMQQKYKMQLQKIKQSIESKNKQYELKILEQHRKHKQNQQKMQEIRKKSGLMAFELQQKELKQQLMSQILKEEQLKRQKQLLQQQQRNKKQQLMQAIRLQQQKYKLQIQRKTVQTYQQEKMKLNEVYLSLKRKNESLQNENIKRNKQLQELQEQKKIEFEEMQKLQKQMEQKQRQFAFKQYLSVSVPPKAPQTAQQMQLQILNDEQQLLQLKQIVKAELMEQIKRKKKEEQQEDRIFEEQRRIKIAAMEEELRKVMKMEEEGLERIEAEYRMKNEQIVKQHQEQLLIQQMTKKKMAQQAEQALKKLQHSQPFQVDTLIAIQTGLENEGNRLKRAISNISDESLQKEKDQFFIDNNKSAIQQAAKTEKNKENPVQQKPNTEKNIQSTKSNVVQPKIESQISLGSQQSIQSPSKYPKIENASNITEQSPQKPSPQKPTQAVKQNSQQIKEKYDLLLQMISKPIKQIFMAYDQIDSYINKFYTQLAHEVKEMIPYSRKQIQSIFREKKVDIFDGFNFGLFRPKQRKFMLFGGIQCIPLIASRYGEIQVEQVYLFNKTNGYQKAFLSKQIKIYEKIGYIYQKKTAEEGIYTIKFIVKIPKEAKKDNHLRDQLQIKNIIHLEDNSSSDVSLIKNNCVFYMLGQALNQSLTQQQKAELAAKNDIQSKYAVRRIKDPAFTNTAVKTQIVSHYITQMTINLPIRYIQTADQPFFTLQTVQYIIKATQERLYVAVFQEHNLAIVIFKMNQSDVPEGFTLETYLQSKFKKMEKMSDLFVFLPVWENSKKYQYKGSTRSFSYFQKTHANLVYGSIVKNKVHKGDFIFLEAPFAFVLFQITSAEVLKRIIFGHVVAPDQILRMKRVIN